MRSPARIPARAILLVLAFVAGLVLQGCFNPFAPLVAVKRGVSEPAPVPNTPEGVLNLFAWCWNQRAYEEYTEIFTDDFEFRFGLADSAGNAYRDRALYRQDELDTARHLFVEGTGTEPPATRISLQFTDRVNPLPDSRPGKRFPWHQEIRRTVVLSIDTQDEQFRIQGFAKFYVVRGDSAKIPEELVRRGFGPDINRWYIERWEDETVESASGLIAELPADTRQRVVRALATAAGTTEPSPRTTSYGLPLEITWGHLKSIWYAP